MTFDNKTYDWSARCNYSLAQRTDSNTDTYKPEFAVYGSFKKCSATSPVNCIDKVTYIENNYASVDIYPSQLNSVEVIVYIKL